MKRSLFITLFLISGVIFGQFKGQENQQPSILNGITNNNPSSLLLGFINPDNLQIHHSLSMSYTSMGNQGVALGVYTGSLDYKFNDKLDLHVAASVVNSPYSSYGQEHANQINGVYLNRAQLNYRPAEDMVISVEFSQMPYSYYSPYYRRSRFLMPSMSDGPFFDK